MRIITVHDPSKRRRAYQMIRVDDSATGEDMHRAILAALYPGKRLRLVHSHHEWPWEVLRAGRHTIAVRVS